MDAKGIGLLHSRLVGAANAAIDSAQRAIDGLGDSGARGAAVATALTRESGKDARQRQRRVEVIPKINGARNKARSGDVSQSTLNSIAYATQKISPEEVNEAGLLERVADLPDDQAARAAFG